MTRRLRIKAPRKHSVWLGAMAAGALPLGIGVYMLAMMAVGEIPMLGLAWLSIAAGLMVGLLIGGFPYCLRLITLDRQFGRLRPVFLSVVFATMAHFIFTVFVMALWVISFVHVEALIDIAVYSLFCWAMISLPLSAVCGMIMRRVAMEREPSPADSFA